MDHVFGDEIKRQRLLDYAEERAAACKARGASPIVWVPQAMFFDGNADDDSIWCNVMDLPYELDHARAIFDAVADQPEVSSVWVGLGDWPRDRPEWPFAQSALVVTAASADRVAAWFQPYTEMVVEADQEELDAVPLDQTLQQAITLSWG